MSWREETPGAARQASPDVKEYQRNKELTDKPREPECVELKIDDSKDS